MTRRGSVSYKELYDDLKRAFGMMEKRLQDRNNYLKNRNIDLTVEKVELEKQLAIITAQNRSLEQKFKSITDDKTKIARLEGAIALKDLELEVPACNLRTLRNDRDTLHDIASDAQMYAILIERLLKAQNDPRIVWPNRPFLVSLKGIKE